MQCVIKCGVQSTPAGMFAESFNNCGSTCTHLRVTNFKSLSTEKESYLSGCFFVRFRDKSVGGLDKR